MPAVWLLTANTDQQNAIIRKYTTCGCLHPQRATLIAAMVSYIIYLAVATFFLCFGHWYIFPIIVVGVACFVMCMFGIRNLQERLVAAYVTLLCLFDFALIFLIALFAFYVARPRSSTFYDYSDFHECTSFRCDYDRREDAARASSVFSLVMFVFCFVAVSICLRMVIVFCKFIREFTNCTIRVQVSAENGSMLYQPYNQPAPGSIAVYSPGTTYPTEGMQIAGLAVSPASAYPYSEMCPPAYIALPSYAAATSQSSTEIPSTITPSELKDLPPPAYE